jgi:hypothetical protein
MKERNNGREEIPAESHGDERSNVSRRFLRQSGKGV